MLVQSNDKTATIELIAKQKTIEVTFDYFVGGDVDSAKDNASENVQFNNHGFLKTPAYYENQNMME